MVDLTSRQVDRLRIESLDHLVWLKVVTSCFWCTNHFEAWQEKVDGFGMTSILSLKDLSVAYSTFVLFRLSLLYM